MKLFSIGIIGYGGFGQFLYHHWSKLKQVRITAIADKMAHKAEGLGQVKVFTDWQDMLREKDISLIAIATEPHSHGEIAIACMEAGKHVLIEKPLALSPSPAEEVIQARDRTKAVAAIDYIMRFHPLLRALRKLTQEGVFGKLRRVDVENYAQDEQLPPEHWFWKDHYSGGILVEHGVHFIDLVHFLHPAEVLSVNGLKHNRNPGQEDQILANVLYEGGLFATHYHSFARPGFFETATIKLAYDLADIELHGWIPLQGEVKALVNPLTKAALLSVPFFELSGSTPIERAADESRPAGWGPAEEAGGTKKYSLHSGGIGYDVKELVTGKFDMRRTKEEVYAGCVQDSLLDVLEKIENPAHQLRAPLEAGLSSLVVATRATVLARALSGP